MQGKFTLIFIKETGRIGIVWYILQSICTSHLVTVATPNKIARDKANGFAREAIQNQLITPDMWSNANNTKQKHDPVSFHWDTPHTRSTVQYKQKVRVILRWDTLFSKVKPDQFSLYEAWSLCI
eukprot:1072852_1